MKHPDWQWNEVQQVGTDYANVLEVENYDARMGTFRNVDGENRDLLEKLALPAGASVLEIGCGTGRFARAASAAGLAATAIDVSDVMVEYVGKKSRQEGHAVATQHAGFLTMHFGAASFDAVVSGIALHHLPDAWKLVALRNIARVLAPNGQLLLTDIVYGLRDGESPDEYFARFVESLPAMRLEAARHVAKEFSTYDWIMEGLVTRAGFTIRSKVERTHCAVLYHCVKA